MEKLVYLNSLFDLYGNLLTEKQKAYFMDYYFNNLSYGEISEKYDISRNAVYHQLKLIEQRLLMYEEKLNLFVKKEKINMLIKQVHQEEIKRSLENLF